MRIFRLFALVAVAAAFSAATFAQQPSAGFHTVVCLKVKPEMVADFRKWETDEAHRFAESRVDMGEITTWYLLRAVMPQGTSVECDYLIVVVYPGAPRMIGGTSPNAGTTKSGTAVLPEDYLKHRNAVSTVVSEAIFQNQLTVGTQKKGDYFQVNYFKIHGDPSEWVAYEKKVWQPFAEAMDKEGLTTGWSLNVAVLPRGSDLPFDGVTIDVYPSMEASFKQDTQFVDRWHKVHPDLELGTTFEQFEKLGSTVMVRGFELEDLITASK